MSEWRTPMPTATTSITGTATAHKIRRESRTRTRTCPTCITTTAIDMGAAFRGQPRVRPMTEQPLLSGLRRAFVNDVGPGFPRKYVDQHRQDDEHQNGSEQDASHHDQSKRALNLRTDGGRKRGRQQSDACRDARHHHRPKARLAGLNDGSPRPAPPSISWLK